MALFQFWAGVRFCARNGAPEALLTDAARAGLHLCRVLPCPGGFEGCCAARRYRALARLARSHRTRLRIIGRSGLFFRLRPLLRRRGLWCGFLLFLPVLLLSQSFLWFVDGSRLSPGQQARAAVVLWESGLFPGQPVTEEKLLLGEYALLQSGEFSWASLNFTNGRLVVEAAAAKPVPNLAAGTLHGIRARVAGTIVSTNLTGGTMLVVPGQVVEAGQGLIGTARAERDGTLVFQPAAGQVIAQFDWETVQEEPLTVEADRLTGKATRRIRLFFGGASLALPVLPASGDAVATVRHFQPEIFGLPLPFSVEETTLRRTALETLERSSEEALALARLHALQALHSSFPDAEIVARKEDAATEGALLRYRVCYTIVADIGEENVSS